MNMAHIDNFRYLQDHNTFPNNPEADIIDKDIFVKSRLQKFDLMLFLEENGSREPIALIDIMNLFLTMDKKLTEEQCTNMVLDHFIQKNINLSEKHIKHEISVLTKLGFKY